MFAHVTDCEKTNILLIPLYDKCYVSAIIAGTINASNNPKETIKKVKFQH